MSVTDRHDMTLAVKVALNPNTTNQPVFLMASFKSRSTIRVLREPLNAFSHNNFRNNAQQWEI